MTITTMSAFCGNSTHNVFFEKWHNTTQEFPELPPLPPHVQRASVCFVFGAPGNGDCHTPSAPSQSSWFWFWF